MNIIEEYELMKNALKGILLDLMDIDKALDNLDMKIKKDKESILI